MSQKTNRAIWFLIPSSTMPVSGNIGNHIASSGKLMNPTANAIRHSLSVNGPCQPASATPTWTSNAKIDAAIKIVRKIPRKMNAVSLHPPNTVRAVKAPAVKRTLKARVLCCIQIDYNILVALRTKQHTISRSVIINGKGNCMKIVLAVIAAWAMNANASNVVDISVAREKTTYGNCAINYRLNGREGSINLSKIESIEVWESTSRINPRGWLMEFITVSGRKYQIPLKPLTDQQLTETRDLLTLMMSKCR